jgi:hypothetical protein
MIQTKFEYYYNNVPGNGMCRNNLVYTSLISEDKKTFCQHFVNDSEYHKGQNTVAPDKMADKWARELCWLTYMSTWYPDLVPEIQEIDLINKKIYLRVDGPDFWEQAGCLTENFDKVLPDWQEQMLNIIKVHHECDMFKYSMHPSSYFVVDGKLKSINYFFTYSKQEGPISIADHQSHLSDNRQADLRKKVEALGMSWNDVTPLEDLEYLCWESFRTNYPDDFVKKVQALCTSFL